jgi:predicted TIM-barrel fold metal-dependent hydrolase
MIVDAHCHTWEEKIMSAELRRVVDAVAEQFHVGDLTRLSDGTGDRLVREMDEAGIDKTVLVAIDAGIAFRSDVTLREYNNYVGDIVRRYPDRIVGFAGIDPRRGKEGIGELERCAEMGLKGLKLWTLTGFYPDDERNYPLYEKAAELGFPILVHTGMGPRGTYLKYNRPVYVDKAAVDFPDTTFIMAHMGQPWVEEAVAILFKNPNVYVDISAWEPICKLAPFVFCQALMQIKLTTGSLRQVLFGSDWPLFTPIMSLKEWVEAIKNLTLPPPLEMLGFKDFTDEDKRLILGENAVRVLGL